MIYLRFPSSQDEMVQYAEIKKPNYSGVLETALKEWYTDSLAQKYSKILGDSLYEVMNFPQDGIYYVNPETQTFFVFSKESNLWIDTKKKVEDYVISSTDKLWEAIFSKHSFLKKVAKLIQSTVENETKKLFKADTWANVSSIDLDSGNVSAVGQETDILNIFKDYFSEKRVNKLYLEVKKTLFSTNSNGIVILFEKEILKGMLTADGYKGFDKSASDQLKEMFSEDMEDKDLHVFISRLQNCFLFGCDFIYPISSYDGKMRSFNYQGLTLDTYDGKTLFIHHISKEFLEKIANEIRSCFKVFKGCFTISYARFASDHFYYYIQGPESITLNGLRIPIVFSYGNFGKVTNLSLKIHNEEPYKIVSFNDLVENGQLKLDYDSIIGRDLVVEII